jgi:hypothetical protein
MNTEKIRDCTYVIILEYAPEINCSELCPQCHNCMGCQSHLPGAGCLVSVDVGMVWVCDLPGMGYNVTTGITHVIELLVGDS